MPTCRMLRGPGEILACLSNVPAIDWQRSTLQGLKYFVGSRCLATKNVIPARLRKAVRIESLWKLILDKVHSPVHSPVQNIKLSLQFVSYLISPVWKALVMDLLRRTSAKGRDGALYDPGPHAATIATAYLSLQRHAGKHYGQRSPRRRR